MVSRPEFVSAKIQISIVVTDVQSTLEVQGRISRPYTRPRRSESSNNAAQKQQSPGEDSLPSKLFRAGGQELVGSMYQLLSKIQSVEYMSVLCPFHKKGDSGFCANYLETSLLIIAQKVLSTMLCDRLKLFMNQLIGNYQFGVRPGKSIIDRFSKCIKSCKGHTPHFRQFQTCF